MPNIVTVDLDALRTAIHQDRRSLEAKESMLAYLEETGKAQTEPTSSAEHPRKTLVEQVEIAVQAMGDKEFLVADIDGYMLSNGMGVTGNAPRARIAATLSKLTDEGKVFKTHEGKGSAPHRFKANDPL